MSKSQYINLCFSDRDRELIVWANMIRDDGQSINTWIQAVLLAEAVGENLDAGSVYAPKIKPKATAPMGIMFGDDTKANQSKKKSPSGWQIRGDNGEIVAGSIISVRVTRPVMVALLDDLHRSHKRLGPYAKAVLRKRIRKLDSGPNIPPDEAQMQDIFALYEDRYVTDNGRQNRTVPNTSNQQKMPPREEPPQQKGQDRSSLPAERNPQFKDNRPRQQNRNNRKPRPQQSQTQQPQVPPKPQSQEQVQEKEVSTKIKNPLLGYIN